MATKMIMSDGLNGVMTSAIHEMKRVRDPWCIMFGPMKLKRAPSKKQRRAGGGIPTLASVVFLKFADKIPGR